MPSKDASGIFPLELRGLSFIKFTTQSRRGQAVRRSVIDFSSVFVRMFSPLAATSSLIVAYGPIISSQEEDGAACFLPGNKARADRVLHMLGRRGRLVPNDYL